jgi:hypothetical protein
MYLKNFSIASFFIHPGHFYRPLLLANLGRVFYIKNSLLPVHPAADRNDAIRPGAFHSTSSALKKTLILFKRWGYSLPSSPCASSSPSPRPTSDDRKYFQRD